MKKFVVLLLAFAISLFAIENLEGKPVSEIKIAKDAQCPIKYVPLEKHRDWFGVIQLRDGKEIVLSSPKYTFQYFYLEGKKHEEGINGIYLTDYKTKLLVNAIDAYYVFGSNIMSVGGDDLIVFADEEDAKEFSAKHKGKKIYRHDRMTKKFVDYLEKR